MILCVGLSPAWQYVYQLAQFHVGGVHRADRVIQCASGKVINVAAGAAALGAHSYVLTVAGGAIGAQLAADLTRRDIAHCLIESTAATRTCTTIVQLSAQHGGGGATELVENASALSIDELQRFIDAYRQRLLDPPSCIVLAGSLPPSTPVTLYGDLLRGTDVPAIVDAVGEPLLAALSARPMFVKPNRTELAQTIGKPITSNDDLRSAMFELNRRGARWVVVTDGENPVWVSGKSGIYQFVLPPITPVNTIGSGDCLAAGIATSLSVGRRSLEAVRWGIAAALANAETLQPADIDMLRVGQLAGQIVYH